MDDEIFIFGSAREAYAARYISSGNDRACGSPFRERGRTGPYCVGNLSRLEPEQIRGNETAKTEAKGDVGHNQRIPRDGLSACR